MGKYTIVWLIYLALTLWLTAFVVTLIIDGYTADFLNNRKIIEHTIDRGWIGWLTLIVCILWSIWYFYYLH